MSERPSTPPRANPPPSTKSPLTPEQVRRIEENRLRAKTLRAQREAQDRATGAASTNPSSNDSAARTPSGFIAGQKRPYAATASTGRAAEPTYRDARQPQDSTAGGDARKNGKAGEVQAARKFMQYVEYDFSKMTDSKGGFMAADDDPFNKAMQGGGLAGAGVGGGSGDEEKPAHMTLKEWERHQLLRKLREQRAGPFEPGISALQRADGKPVTESGCAECGTLEIDWKWQEVFGVRVCTACKEKIPEKYSLLTKTEAREDYLLTDPELKDEELLPRLERPNPHKSSWNNMMLYLRCQVEAYAFSKRKWGSEEALDEEFQKREKEKKRRKEEKFKSKLLDLKKRTRVEAYKRGREKVMAGGDDATAQFGDKIHRRGEKHEHEWGRPVENEEGMTVKRCIDCGMEVEELEL